MCKLLRYSSFSSNVSVDALSITKQIQCPYIAIEGFIYNINYIKKKTIKRFISTSQCKMKMLDQSLPYCPLSGEANTFLFV